MNDKPTFLDDNSNTTHAILNGTAPISAIDQNFTVSLLATDGYESATNSFIVEVLENKQPTPTVTQHNITLLEGDTGTDTIPMFNNYSESDVITYT